MTEIEAKIAEAEKHWKQSIGETKAAVWEICKDLYEQRDDLKRLDKLGKTNLN